MRVCCQAQQAEGPDRRQVLSALLATGLLAGASPAVADAGNAVACMEAAVNQLGSDH